MKKWIFFDIDNTLFDSKELALRARKNAIKAMIDAGLEVEEDEAYKRLKRIIEKQGSNYDRHFDELIESYRAPSSRLVAAGTVAYHDTKNAYLVPYPEVVPTLLKLKESGHKLGIISNGLAKKQWEKLIRLGLQHLFEVVVISEDAGVEKPDEEIFKIAMQKAKCSATHSIMVGDKEDDVLPAKKLGMETIGINMKKARVCVENFDEIIKGVDKIG